MLKIITKFLFKKDYNNINKKIYELNSILKVYKKEYASVNKKYITYKKEISNNKGKDPFKYSIYTKFKSKRENYIDLIESIEKTILLYKKLYHTIILYKRKKIKNNIKINEFYIRELIYIIKKFY